MLDTFKSNLVKFCGNIGVVTVSLFATAVGSFIVTDDIIHEGWDNESTQLTNIANEDFQSRIKKITVLQKTQDIVADKQTMFEYKNLDSNFDLNSPQWVDYKAEEANFKQRTQSLSERLSQEKQSFFNNIMLNTDITEAGWGNLTAAFEEETSLDMFAQPSSGYALRECQLESSKQGLTSLTARAEFTNSCVKQEGLNDDALPFVTSILGFFSVAIAMNAIATTGRRKKYQKKKMN